jgi:hypothetical protein
MVMGVPDKSVNSHKKTGVGVPEGFSEGVNVNVVFAHCGVFGEIVKLASGGEKVATVKGGDVTEGHPVPVTITV